MGVKTHLRAVLLSAAFSVPAVAQGLEPCAQAFPSASALYDALKAEGWSVSAPSQARTDILAWINAVAYIGGDMGGATLADVFASQRMAAANYGRLKSLPTSETRVLTDGEAVLIASWQRPTPALAVVQCRVAFTEPAAASEPSQGRFGTHTQTKLAGDTTGLSEYRFHFDRDAILEELPDAAPPGSVLNIIHQYQIEASE